MTVSTEATGSPGGYRSAGWESPQYVHASPPGATRAARRAVHRLLGGFAGPGDAAQVGEGDGATQEENGEYPPYRSEKQEERQHADQHETAAAEPT